MDSRKELNPCLSSDKWGSRPRNSTSSSTRNAGASGASRSRISPRSDRCKAVRELRGEAEDQALGALLRLAATDGHDDQLAAVAVLHQLGGSVRTIARHFWHLAGGDVEGIVVGAIWEQIRSYDWRSRRRHHASAIHHGTRKAVRATLMPDTSRTLGRRVVLLNPQSWVFEALAEHDETSGMSLDAFDSRDQLAIFLNWAIGQGVVDDEEIGLLDALMDLDRAQPPDPEMAPRCLLDGSGRAHGLGARALHQVGLPRQGQGARQAA